MNSNHILNNFRIFGTAIALSAVLNLLVPEAARLGYGVLMIVRIAQGLVEVKIILYMILTRNP